MTGRSVIHYTDSRDFGGAEQAMLLMASGLAGRGWTPTVLLDRVPGIEPIVARAATLGLRVATTRPLPPGLEGARRVPALARALRRAGPDVFHAHLSWPMAGKFALAAAIAARVPAVVATVQLVPPVMPDRSSQAQLRLVAGGVGRYLAVSQDIARRLAADYGWPASKVEVVHNSAPVTDHAPADLAPDVLRPVVLTPARLDPQKGHEVLLEAAARLPGVGFLLAGDGPERPALEAQAERLGVADRVSFLGRRDDVPALLAACDVFALPSRFEGTSLAVLEAMAAGRPVVASRIPGTDELVVDGETGFLVEPGDAGELAERLGRLLGDPELRRAFGERARRRAQERFAPERGITRVAEVYAELLAA